MKVKIRGLVFVGFAAAVFAQSAMADNTTDAKTVTSKLYVDTTFQTLNNITTTSELTVGGSVTEQMVNAHWASDSEYPSMAVLNQVKSQVTGINVDGDETYINVADSNGTFTVSPKLAPATTAAELTGPLTNDVAGAFTGTNGDKLVTATSVKALIDTESSAGVTTLSDAATGGSTNATVPTSRNVVDYAEKKANKATSITTGDGGNSTSNTAYPTTKAVYDFVTTQGGNFQPKVDAAAATTMYVGKYVPADGNTPASATWDKLTTGTYVSNTSSTTGTYTLDIPTAKITSATSDFAASGDTRAKLATAGTVYDFVNGNYQAKAATGSTTVQVGHDGGWTNLAGGDSYVSVAYDSTTDNRAEVTLTNLTGATSDFVATGDTNATTNRPKLARAGDVYDFVMAQTNGLTIPAMPSECTSAAEAGGYCALVYGVSSGTAGQQGATYALQWTVMAPAPASGNSGNNG